MKKPVENETTAAASLHPKYMDHDDLQIIDQAIERCLKLNAAQRNRPLNQVQAMLDSAWSKSGAGVPEGAAERNRRFNKEEIDIEEFDHALNDALESVGFNEENKQKAADLFFEAVEAKLALHLVPRSLPCQHFDRYCADELEGPCHHAASA